MRCIAAGNALIDLVTRRLIQLFVDASRPTPPLSGGLDLLSAPQLEVLRGSRPPRLIPAGLKAGGGEVVKWL